MKTIKNKLGTIIFLAAVAAAFGSMGTTQNLQAATILVTSTADGGPDAPLPGTLRAALASAGDGDTVDATGVTGTITLEPGLITSAQLVVDKNITILGPGPDQLTVDANHLSRVLHVVVGHTVVLDGLTLVNGVASGSFPANAGGGIYNDQSVLTVNNCVLRGNSATLGGGIENDGRGGSATLTLSNCTVSGNSAVSHGGGILNDGIDSGSATATIVNSILSGNSGFEGGAIFNNAHPSLSTQTASATLTVSKSTLSNNTADSDGGGIYNDGVAGSALLTVVDSTLNGNSASNGGGLFNNGAIGSAIVTVSNSTLSGNSADFRGGGIFNSGQEASRATVSLADCTLSGNSAGLEGGGIYNRNLLSGIDTTIHLGNTLLNAGSPGENILNEDGAVISHGFNLSSDDGGGFLVATGDQTNTDPKLGPLQDNGGPTRTHAPLPGSPAIDQGSSNTIGALTTDTDQRGSPRTVDDLNIANAPFGDGTDIGAVEVATPNHAPVAKCKNVTVLAGPNGTADASVDDGSFDSDSGDTITLVQTPPGPYPIGTTTVTLTATDSHGDSSSCTATVTVQGVSDLVISKAVISGQAKPGQVLTYTIVVKNQGPNPATGVVINDAVPQGTVFASAAPTPATAPAVGTAGTVTWSLGSLASGASATFTLNVKVSLKGNALIVNTATASSSSSDPNPANNTVTVTSKRNTK